jgi:ketosteroid isomerase-like protein
MAGQAAETVRHLLDHWARGDFAGPAGSFDEQVVFVLGPGFPEPGIYHGIGELADYTRGLVEPWDRLTIELEELIENGDTVFAAVKQSGTGTSSGVPTEFTYSIVFTVRAGKVIRFDSIRDRGEALAAAGIAG